jgi:hypothetical protein
MNSVSIRALFVMPPRTRAQTAYLRSAWCSTCLGASLRSCCGSVFQLRLHYDTAGFHKIHSVYQP